MASFMNKSSDPRLQAYTAVKQIGKGSYGEVFLVKHTREKKQFVMKNIKLTASSAKERLAAEQEAVLLGQLKHPNIVSYKESFQDEHGMLHIVMGYCEGGDLCTRLKSYKGQYLPETQVVEWFVQIALGLQYLHERNILHRDLKTQNIFLSKNDIIKVGDLGIARVLDGSCDLAHTVIGTPYYMSPELFANEPYNHKSDVWALGCCVYEMATLKHAFTANNLNALMYKIIKGKVPALPRAFSDQLSELVQQMMAHRAEDRPSVQQLLRNSFVRRHIKLFLDRAASKKRKSGRTPLNPPTEHKPRDEGKSVSARSSERVEGKRASGGGQSRRTSSLTSLPQSSSRESGYISSSSQATECSSQQHDSCTLTEKTRLTNTKETGPDVTKETGPDVTKETGPDVTKETGPDVTKETGPDVTKETGPDVTKETAPDSAKETVSKPKEAVRGTKPGSGRRRELSGGPSPKRPGPQRKRPPRPLPPDPLPKSGSPTTRSRLHPLIRKVSSNDSPTVGSGEDSPKVSSARERRRRNKQQEGGGVKGRVVLRSRSSSDLSRGDKSVRGDSGAEDVADGPSKPPEETAVNGEDKRSKVLQAGSEMVSQHSGSEHDLRDSGSSNEVDEFLTLLDSTLHLPEPPVRARSKEPPPARQAFIQHQSPIVSEVSDPMLQSGRLGDRIVALRRECVAGLGERLMREAALILDQNDPEEAEELLLRALGRQLFDKYAGKLQHLNFCEDNVRTDTTSRS